MVTPVNRTWRTDDVTVVQWEMESDGADMKEWIEDNVLINWTVSLVPYRTVVASSADGSESFSVDRGGYLAKTSDGKIVRTDAETLNLLFN